MQPEEYLKIPFEKASYSDTIAAFSLMAKRVGWGDNFEASERDIDQSATIVSHYINKELSGLFNKKTISNRDLLGYLVHHNDTGPKEVYLRILTKQITSHADAIRTLRDLQDEPVSSFARSESPIKRLLFERSNNKRLAKEKLLKQQTANVAQKQKNILVIMNFESFKIKRDKTSSFGFKIV